MPSTRTRLPQLVAKYPERCPAELALMLGVSRERIRQLAKTLDLHIVSGRDPGFRQKKTRQKLASIRALVWRNTSIRNVTHLCAALGMARPIVDEYLKNDAPQVLALFARRTKAQRANTIQAAVLRTLQSNPTTPYCDLARRLNMDVVNFSARAWKLNIEHGGRLSTRRRDGRAERYATARRPAQALRRRV